MNLSPVNWAEVRKDARVFFLENGDVFIFSKNTWRDLPCPAIPQPSGVQYEKDAREYGRLLAKHIWRQREGRSRYGSIASDPFLGEQLSQARRPWYVRLFSLLGVPPG